MTVAQDATPYAIRGYAPSDEDGVLRLLHLSLGDGGSFVRNAEFWRWKHFRNPFGASQLLLASGEEILGLRAFMRWAFRTPAGRVRAVRCVDTATHPAARRLGIFLKLTQMSLEKASADGVHLVFNTPNPQSMAGYLKLGWRLVGRPRLLLRPLNLGRLAAVMLRRHRDGASIDRGEIVGASFPPVEELLAHRDVEGLIAADDALRADGIRTERSLSFMRWRYASVPSLPYFALAEGMERLRAVAIFRPNLRRGLREIMLTEVLAGADGGPAVRTLIRALARRARADYLVAAAAPGSAHWRMLRAAGFLPLPAGSGPNFTVYPLAWPPGGGDHAHLDHWRFSLGDLEIF